MKIKIVTLLVFAMGFVSCDDVDTAKLLGIDKDTVVPVTVTEEVQVAITSQTWDTIYKYDLSNEAKEFTDNIESINFENFNYTVTQFQGGAINSGNVEVYLGVQEAEVNRHDSFSQDVSLNKEYIVDNQVKINGAKEELAQNKKIDVRFKVVLDEAPQQGSPVLMNFEYSFKADLSGITDVDLGDNKINN